MNNQGKRVPEDIAPEVLELASRYYTHQNQGYSASELVAAGKEVDIPAEFIQQAILDVQAKHKQQLQQQQQLTHLRQKILIAATGVVAALSVWSAWTYNSIQNSNSKVQAAWAQVENQLQRRADLIPNLVNVTLSYAKQEKELVSLLVRSHEAYLQAATPDDKAAATVQVNQAIDRFRDYATINPQLRSSQLFTNLQYEITGTENRLAVERMRYNQAVQAYNQKIQTFPNFLVANTLGFEKKEFLKAINIDVPKIPG
ncbi:LemA family protein [Anabaena sp. WFMT]|uniref:LemA family protein n=1 Tax=Anabaena sp. WFMT TaxID=3449730 RepID=UPI003F271AA3